MKSRAWVDAFCGSRATLYQRIAGILSPAILGGALLFVALRWRVLPERIPTNWNFAGEITGWGSRATLLIMPLIGLAVDITMFIVGRFPQSWNTGVRVTVFNRVRVYRLIRDMMADLRLSMALLFAGITVWLCLTPDALPGWVLMAATVALILLPIIRYFVRALRAR